MTNTQKTEEVWVLYEDVLNSRRYFVQSKKRFERENHFFQSRVYITEGTKTEMKALHKLLNSTNTVS